MSGMPMLSLVPVEGDSKDKPVSAQYNPVSLSFVTKAKYDSDKDKAAGSTLPNDVKYRGGEPINISVELLFDCYENEGDARDVRPIVKDVLALTVPMDVKDKNDESHVDKRPPRVMFVWKDSDPLGTGEPYFAVLTSVGVDYTMFLDDGTPCRAKIKVDATQADPYICEIKDGDASEREVSISGFTPAKVEALARSAGKTGQALVSEGKSDAKIEEPATWPSTVKIPIKSK